MRENLPTIDHEFAFPPGETLVSTTDLKGRITYCNPSFVHVSGYSREELLGQPHNLIRHPDMPEEAFRDMWQTIQSGQPWSATVKNRRKDGSYYWVQANVTPLLDDHGVVGYMSVRTQASDEDIARAHSLYRAMREERQAGHQRLCLLQGQLVVDTVLGRLKQRLHIGVAGCLTAFNVAAAALTFVGGMASNASGLSGSVWTYAGVTLALCALAALTLWMTDRMAVAPIQRLIVQANRMAAGDLTQVLHTKRSDVIGRLTLALNQLNVNLRSIVRDARNEVESMLTATSEIATGNEDLSARTESQAGSLQETAASMDQITGSVQSNTSIANEAAKLANETMAITRQSSEVVGDVTQTMQVIEDSSRRITDIIQVIDSIAFQTNILALNAAVEAARAGEQGRGFAVVASEVRALAQRTATAAREVKQLIMDSSEKVQAGSTLTQAATRTMTQALISVERVTALVGSLSQGSTEQLTGISQINEAVNHLDGITQQNAAAVEQIAAASRSVAHRAQTVAATVQVFRLNAQDRAVRPDAVALRKEMRLHNA